MNASGNASEAGPWGSPKPGAHGCRTSPMMIWERKSYALMNGIDLALLIEVQGIALRFDAVATILNQAATFSSVATVLPREDFGEENPHIP